MYDPMTVAFEIKSPFKFKKKHFPNGYRNTWITIWHADPETDHTDDSCGWFPRTRHGDQKLLEKIRSRIRFEFQSSSDEFEHGMFDRNGVARFSKIAITLNLFRAGAYIYFKHNWKKTDKFMQSHVLDLIRFAENPIDSVSDLISNRYNESIDDRAEMFADIIFSWLLRKTRPWYKHPRWHMHHWKIQLNFIQDIKRWLFPKRYDSQQGKTSSVMQDIDW